MRDQQLVKIQWTVQLVLGGRGATLRCIADDDLLSGLASPTEIAETNTNNL